MKINYFTSECVSPGHPDKICDQISDAILDACLEQDKNSRVACETFATTGFVLVGGEITTRSKLNIQKIVRGTIEDLGYLPGLGFDYHCGIANMIHSQSPDIAQGVDTGGAGDQGIMFGGAINETPELMPLGIVLARKLIKQFWELKEKGILSWARPDAKAQVTVAYNKYGDIIGIDTIVLSVQHAPDVDLDKIKFDLKTLVIKSVLLEYGFFIEDVNKIHINPTGRFVIGGPHGDTGLTGRKIIVDTYGGYFRHGGGAFSGKDSSKVDRSAAYAARWIAKNIVAAGIAKKCEVQLSYAIGVAEPTSILIDTFGTSELNHLPEDDIIIAQAVKDIFDLTPRGIEKALDLRTPKFKYKDLAAFGHIGRIDIELPWEKLNMINKLKIRLGL